MSIKELRLAEALHEFRLPRVLLAQRGHLDAKSPWVLLHLRQIAKKGNRLVIPFGLTGVDELVDL